MTIISRNSAKLIHLCVGDEGVRLFLTELLAEWNFTVFYTFPDSEDQLLLADSSCRTGGHRQTLRLSSVPLDDEEVLLLPLTIESLWIALETRFHRPPRKHLRLPVDYTVTATLRGQQVPAQMISLSPLGARFWLPRELAPDEGFAIELSLPERSLHIDGRVIYVNALGEHQTRFDTGAIFDRIDPLTRENLRDHIILSFLQHIRPNMPTWAFVSGVEFFDLPPSVRAQL